MFKKILVANRSEIALRIIRTCREMDIEVVSIYSLDDKESQHVYFANQSFCIGESRSSYLNMHSILTVALQTGCDAIHPGYGFLSENSEFARLCEKCNIKFIGPSYDTIDFMGNKFTARQLMIKAGVPVVPGSSVSFNDAEIAKKTANSIGYPLLIKAAAGGGGKGMRKVFNEYDFINLFNQAKSESVNSFKSDEMYIEKLIINPKHIEIQVMADNYGNVVHLGERECSIQRNNQKLIEESPSPSLNIELRKRMCEDAVIAAKAANYVNVGTIEFVLDQNNNYFFIEMNTRIQVEHGITEIVTGIDIVKEQIKISSNFELSYKQENIVFKGHAIECRINAENPWNGFLPTPGKIEFLHLPNGNGVRIDSSIYSGITLSPFYDSMMIKVMAFNGTRLTTIKKMRRALEELVIEGVSHNTQLLHFIMFHPDFIKGDYNTGFLEQNMNKFIEMKDSISNK